MVMIAGADQVQLAYLILTPVWHNVILPVNTPADNATCIAFGAFLGSDSSFLYICTASGMVKRAALSTYASMETQMGFNWSAVAAICSVLGALVLATIIGVACRHRAG